jgi:hypothetical protein
MRTWLKRQWRAFKKSPSGQRFKELYERRERAPHARVKKLLFLGGGVAAIAVGIVTYPIPVIPSDFIILFGIASIAQASWYGARMLDWLEFKLRAPFRVAYRWWKPLPRWAKAALSVLWCFAVGGIGYGIYRAFAD